MRFNMKLPPLDQMNFIMYPEPGYDMPIFLFFCLLTGRKAICHVNVNCTLSDEAYLQKWVAPLVAAQNKYGSFDCADRYPEWMQKWRTPAGIYGMFPRDRFDSFMRCGTEYLDIYLKLARDAEPVRDTDRLARIQTAQAQFIEDIRTQDKAPGHDGEIDRQGDREADLLRSHDLRLRRIRRHFGQLQLNAGQERPVEVPHLPALSAGPHGAAEGCVAKTRQLVRQRINSQGKQEEALAVGRQEPARHGIGPRRLNQHQPRFPKTEARGDDAALGEFIAPRDRHVQQLLPDGYRLLQIPDDEIEMVNTVCHDVMPCG